MPIAFECGCGRGLRVKDELAGRKIRCPHCADVVAVPAADDGGFEVVDEPPPEPRRPARARAVVVDDDPPPRPVARRAYDDDDDDEPPPPRKKKTKRPRPSRSYDDEPRHRSGINSGVAGGLTMMLVAVVWFVAGLWFGWIFFYPPILLVIGFVAVVRGLINGE